MDENDAVAGCWRTAGTRVERMVLDDLDRAYFLMRAQEEESRAAQAVDAGRRAHRMRLAEEYRRRADALNSPAAGTGFLLKN